MRNQLALYSMMFNDRRVVPHCAAAPRLASAAAARRSAGPPGFDMAVAYRPTGSDILTVGTTAKSAS